MFKAKGTPSEIYNKVSEYLENAPEDKQMVVLIANSETKEMKTRQQEKTYWKIFGAIGNKLGYKKEVVKRNILTALFGTYECKMFGEVHLVPNKLSTTELSKEEASQLIDASLDYAKRIKAGIQIEPLELSNLYESHGIEYHPMSTADQNFTN